ncbi:MAG: hypothetical protein ACPGUD_06335 [Parashewanella sp.]
MKLAKVLIINDQEVELISHQLVLELSSAGRGILEIKGKAKRGQQVSFSIGYDNKVRRWFTGFVSKVIPVNDDHQKIMVRELCAILDEKMPVSIQHATFKKVITALSELSGLSFVLSDDADYLDLPIPNFTSHGTGFQLLTNAARAFGIADFCWYQQSDGQIFVGSYQDSRWHNKPVAVPASYSKQQYLHGWKLIAIPSMRPGAKVNDTKVNHVELINDEMVISWQVSNKDNKKTQRLINQAFPELAGKYHLPHLAEVVATCDSAENGDMNNSFRPRYAVDLQLLDENCNIDKTVPVYKAIPLPVNFSGIEKGLMQYPEVGTIVEIGFAYGRADKPFIRTILGQDWTLPSIAPGEQLQQQRAEVFERTDSAGNQTQATDQKQIHIARERITKAKSYLAELGESLVKVDQHSTEEITGTKLIEALGAIELLAGDDISIGSLGNMHQTTAGELSEVIGKHRRSIAKDMHWLESAKHWAGTEQTNIYDLLHQLMQCVELLADHCAKHTHEYIKPAHAAGKAKTAKPDLESDMNNRKNISNALHQTLEPILAEE